MLEAIRFYNVHIQAPLRLQITFAQGYIVLSDGKLAGYLWWHRTWFLKTKNNKFLFRVKSNECCSTKKTRFYIGLS
jgi:hypothetical protein